MTVCSPPQSFILCPPAQPVPSCDLSSPSVGLVDVWPPSMGFSSSHVPHGLPVVLVCHQLEWVVCLLPPVASQHVM